MTHRRPRLRREDTRSMFIEAGRSILRQEGLAVGGEALKLKRVSDQVESDFGIWCTNASITGRLWDTQSEYQADVLVTIAADDSNSEVAASLDRMTSFIANMDTSSHAARPWSLRELCRKVSVVHLDTLRNSTDWSFWIGIWAITAVGSAPERRQRIDEALRQSYLDVTDQMEAIYSSLLGYRLRLGLTIRQFAIASAALTEGCVPRDRVDSEQMDGILRPTGRNSVEREWTLFGLELYALAEQFFELDPDWPKLATTGQGQPRAARESTSRKGMFVRCPD
jgi:hypothetical protein